MFIFCWWNIVDCHKSPTKSIGTQAYTHASIVPALVWSNYKFKNTLHPSRPRNNLISQAPKKISSSPFSGSTQATLTVSRHISSAETFSLWLIKVRPVFVTVSYPPSKSNRALIGIYVIPFASFFAHDQRRQLNFPRKWVGWLIRLYFVGILFLGWLTGGFVGKSFLF